MLGAGFGRTGGANCDDRHHASQEKYLHGSHAQQTSEGRGLFQLPIDARGASLGSSRLAEEVMAEQIVEPPSP